MPKTTIASETKRDGTANPHAGRKFLVFDPRVPGDLPDAKAQALFDKQSATLAKHKAEKQEFVDYMQALAIKGGMSAKPVVIFNAWGSVSVTVDDGKGKGAKAKQPTLAGKDLDWSKVESLMKA
jgi:hypothetical protein